MALTKESKQAIIRDFARTQNDTGSVEVQVAILTHDIRSLTEHCKNNPHDFSSRRGLLIKVSQRRTFLKYLEKHNKESYSAVIQRLGLKK